ncbi:hypothetical protein LEP1GSC070_2243 [Leptospira santarosai str. AIM]|nr:hypothetical protein LEP1GSC070_2243 [Leptospira santarosai str. AIM]
MNSAFSSDPLKVHFKVKIQLMCVCTLGILVFIFQMDTLDEILLFGNLGNLSKVELLSFYNLSLLKTILTTI